VLRAWLQQTARRWSLVLVEKKPFDPDMRDRGKDWPLFGYTMIGMKRLDNIQACIEDILANDVPGHLIETGVWRGGATILMRAVLKRHGVTDRIVWVADSFEGLPKPDVATYGADAGGDLSENEVLKVSLEQVQANFARFGVLDDQVRFLKGWFCDTLPTAPIEKLALLRLDGDLYESTIDALNALYHRLSPGGYVIVDDYFTWHSCRKAVIDFRTEHNIDAEIINIDDSAVYWQVPFVS
jgi:O-methyltransferase